ncbi:TetR/AcrR family transcriptional regulator C-terminal domain-containing protein [Saccharothrix sp. AJ9571]|nr:TetR/AcrR family transcriptional regulator C-terminal domain-containing protein [Saccharothrix sp. AJ9571]
MLIATGPPTPGTVNATIRALTLLQAAGLDADVAARVQRSVISYLVGWVLIEQGVATEQRQANFTAALHLAQGRGGAAVAAAIAPDRSAKGEFEFGLELILHGLAARLAGSSPAAP